MNKSKLAQKRHNKKLKRRDKKFSPGKHNRNLLDYCKKILPPEVENDISLRI